MESEERYKNKCQEALPELWEAYGILEPLACTDESVKTKRVPRLLGRDKPSYRVQQAFFALQDCMYDYFKDFVDYPFTEGEPRPKDHPWAELMLVGNWMNLTPLAEDDPDFKERVKRILAQEPSSDRP